MKRWFNDAPIRTKILVYAIAIVLIVGSMSSVVYAGIVASIDVCRLRSRLRSAGVRER